MIKPRKKHVPVPRLEHVPKKELAKHKDAKITLVVHPYFNDSANIELDKHFSSGDYKKGPTIISEEWENIGKTRKKLEKFGVGPEDPVYIIATKTRRPDPTIGWQKVFFLMDQMAPKEIHIGGKALHGNPPALVSAMARKLASRKGPRKRGEKYAAKLARTSKRANIITDEFSAWTGCAGATYSKFVARGKNNYKVSLIKDKFR